MTMEYRQLPNGNENEKFSVLGLGMGGIGKTPVDEIEAIIRKAINNGINPFNGAQSFVSYQNTRFIVLWSKNPEPLLQHIDYLKELNIGCYIQFTLNDYEAEGLERGVPPLAHRIDTFRRLVDTLGVGRIVWRFDPLILTDRITPETLLQKIEHIGNQLNG